MIKLEKQKKRNRGFNPERNGGRKKTTKLALGQNKNIFGTEIRSLFMLK